ncbi:MAG: aspartate-semialdehyde dehydrogenase [Bryobacterales bacterium]|nr:aspartate-semialdehyde dehydrogenase [Bryobacteraceae bacterium]MDW8353186.1 aspartate-semialdehyde dehydrogenase [Bryobacterales bacterium]
MQPKIEVGILGATGMVGQQFVKFLQNHPWFEVKWLGASDRSAGKKYRDATEWRLGGETPEFVADLTVEDCKPGNAPRLLFSAMDASVAGEIEQAFARAGHVVVSNARNHRMDPDVPLLVPEINPDHLRIIPTQQRNRGWKGQIVTNPNCSTVVLTLGLAPFRPFGITRVIATTLQAVSGAGYPGVPSWDINANIIPFISGEEEKMQTESLKILGRLEGDRFAPLPAKVSAHCNRVPVVDGHTVTVSVELAAKPSEADLRAAIESFAGVPQERKLPSAPARPIIYMNLPNRPQPRKDVERERGMAVFIGRLRPCPVLDFKFVALGHNTVRGAAGAAVLNAELMVSEGMLD